MFPSRPNSNLSGLISAPATTLLDSSKSERFRTVITSPFFNSWISTTCACDQSRLYIYNFHNEQFPVFHIVPSAGMPFPNTAFSFNTACWSNPKPCMPSTNAYSRYSDGTVNRYLIFYAILDLTNDHLISIFKIKSLPASSSLRSAFKINQIIFNSLYFWHCVSTRLDSIHLRIESNASGFPDPAIHISWACWSLLWQLLLLRNGHLQIIHCPAGKIPAKPPIV